MRVGFTAVSHNKKTGPIPVTMTSADTCPPSCAFRGSGCYAEGGPLNMAWRAVSNPRPGSRYRTHTWGELCTFVRRLPRGQLWRHNQAGDLPGQGDCIDTLALAALVEANRGRRGFTYTHKPMGVLRNRQAVFAANRSGFTVNLSADNLAQADELAALGAGPVVAVVPQDTPKHGRTPGGRRFVVCPAQTAEDMNCARCGWCAQADRQGIVAFRVHGRDHKRALRVVQG